MWVTSQVKLDSYTDSGLLTAVDFVNALAIERSRGRIVTPSDPLAAIARVVAQDPPSVAQLRAGHVPAFTTLARELRAAFDELSRDDVDAAAARLNDLLARHPAHPHLAKEGGIWRLHHHPGDAPLVPMWTAVCAEGMARMIGAGHAPRFGTCAANDCERVFFDTSRNASRRYCSTTCQNREKTAAFRRRARAGPRRPRAGAFSRDGA
jgi:predicted RNA-binding Zn ribbon-like protein